MKQNGREQDLCVPSLFSILVVVVHYLGLDSPLNQCCSANKSLSRQRVKMFLFELEFYLHGILNPATVTICYVLL